MESTMNVSFTGIQNASGVVYPGAGGKLAKRVVVQLTDKGTKDLTEFKDVLKRFPDQLSNGFLKIDSKLIENADGKASRKFFINDKELEMKDENLSVFSKIAGILRRITESTESFPVSNDYLDSGDCFINILRNPNHFTMTDETMEILKEAHSHNTLQNVAQLINNAISNKMAKLFNVI